MTKNLVILLALTLVADPLQAGPSDAYAPLSLITNGLGRILPYQNGDLLAVGRRYTLSAIPAPGYVFASWNPVLVFNFSETTVGPSGQTNPPVVSEIVSPVPRFTTQPSLTITNQAVQVLINEPGTLTVTESAGWEANFVPENKKTTVESADATTK